jgi:hypothetical protein
MTGKADFTKEGVGARPKKLEASLYPSGSE